MASILTRAAGATLLAAGALWFQADAASAATLHCIQGSGGTGSTALDLVDDGCVATKDEAGYGVYGPPGGDSEEAVEKAILMATDVAVNISLFGKSEGATDTSLIDITPLTFNSDGGILTGEWRILRDDVLIKYITIKAGTSYVLFELAAGATSGVFSTAALRNNGGKQPAVSHISLWISKDVTVPEPGTLAVFGAGLMSLGGLMRRKARV